MPPTWCSGICRNAMNEVCVEHCAIKRDCSAFDPKPDISLNDLPRFPLKETKDLSKEEKFTVVTVYLSAITDHLKGEPNEPMPTHTRKPPHNHDAGNQVFADGQLESALHNLLGEKSLPPTDTVGPDSPVETTD